MLEAGNERLESVLVLLLAGRRQGAHRAAVEGVPGRDDLPAVRGEPLLGVLPRELDRRLVGLRPRVAEEHAIGERVLAQQLGQVDLRGRVIEVRHVEQRRRRFLDGARHARMTVTERGHGDPGPEVEVLAAVRVPHAHPVAAHQADRRPRRRVDPLKCIASRPLRRLGSTGSATPRTLERATG